MHVLFLQNLFLIIYYHLQVPLNVTSETLPERPGAPDCPVSLYLNSLNRGLIILEVLKITVYV